MAKVLVVDDEPAIRASLARALELDRYSVELASDGEAALERLAAEAVDAIVLDIAMPGIDGLKVRRQLRNRGERTPC